MRKSCIQRARLIYPSTTDSLFHDSDSDSSPSVIECSSRMDPNSGQGSEAGILQSIATLLQQVESTQQQLAQCLQGLLAHQDSMQSSLSSVAGRSQVEVSATPSVPLPTGSGSSSLRLPTPAKFTEHQRLAGGLSTNAKSTSRSSPLTSRPRRLMSLI